MWDCCVNFSMFLEGCIEGEDGPGRSGEKEEQEKKGESLQAGSAGFANDENGVQQADFFLWFFLVDKLQQGFGGGSSYGRFLLGYGRKSWREISGWRDIVCT